MERDMFCINYRLISAVRGGNLKRTEDFNAFGLSSPLGWSEGYILLCEALKYKQVALAKLLLTNDCKVNSKSIKPSHTPLHLAVEKSVIEIVEMILNKGAIIDAKNENGCTPLHYAVLLKKMEITELLLKYGANVNATDDNDKSLLHIAIERGFSQIVEYPLNCEAWVNYVCTSEFKKGYTTLHFAVEGGSDEIITLLLSRGAGVNVKGKDGITPLHIAARKGYSNIVENLLNHGACSHSLTLNKGYTPLYFASEVGCEEAVKLFLNRGADINASTKSNETPLHIAMKKGHKTIVKLLLQHGAKGDNQDENGQTILDIAVEREYLTTVKDILKYCPDIVNQSNRSSLKIAVQGYGEECKKIVEVLLEYGFTVNSEDANDTELLHAAVGNGHLKIVEDLLKFGANVNTTYRGFTPLQNAAKEKQEEVAKLLISYEADINAQDEIGKTPIFYAIENVDLKITKLLLSSGANIKNSPELLNVAVTKECVEIIEALLQHDADINVSDQYGRTALHCTIDIERVDSVKSLTSKYKYIQNTESTIKGVIAKMLLSKGANANSQYENGLTMLHAAVIRRYAKVVEALLEYNANVDCREKRDITPLHLSALTGNEEISTMLLNKGANVNAKEKNGFTALHIAIGKGHSKIVKLLLECGAKIDPNTESGSTALHLAAQKGNQEVIETILKFGVDINSRDVYGKTALHIASRAGHIKVVRTLLEYGSDINITCVDCCTPRDYAKAGIKSLHDSDVVDYDSDDDGDFIFGYGICPYKEIDEALEHHIVKMKIANLYISRKNLLSLSDEIRDFQEECEIEIASMKSEKINNANISFYNILTKDTSSLEICMRNENIMQILKTDVYETKFPIYASMIENHLRKGMERKELLKQGNTIFYLFFNNFLRLSHDCTEKIFSYLSNEDLRTLMDACKPLSSSYPDTNY